MPIQCAHKVQSVFSAVLAKPTRRITSPVLLATLASAVASSPLLPKRSANDELGFLLLSSSLTGQFKMLKMILLILVGVFVFIILLGYSPLPCGCCCFKKSCCCTWLVVGNKCMKCIHFLGTWFVVRDSMYVCTSVFKTNCLCSFSCIAHSQTCTKA